MKKSMGGGNACMRRPMRLSGLTAPPTWSMGGCGCCASAVSRTRDLKLRRYLEYRTVIVSAALLGRAVEISVRAHDHTCIGISSV